jgi:hypothetical protein
MGLIAGVNDHSGLHPQLDPDQTAALKVTGLTHAVRGLQATGRTA